MRRSGFESEPEGGESSFEIGAGCGGGAGADAGDAFGAEPGVDGGVDVPEGDVVEDVVPAGDVSIGDDPEPLVVGIREGSNGVAVRVFFSALTRVDS
jgi:hypothetical protein